MAFATQARYHYPTLLGKGSVSIALVGALLALAAPAAAEDDSANVKGVSFWSVTFLGGVLSPQGPMADTHKAALLTGARVSWTHKSGFGIVVHGEYSPLPRRLGALAPLETYETHFGVATIGPRFVLGRGFARLWASGGGGVSYEHTTRKYRDDMGRPVEETNDDVAPVVVATTGLELHFMKSGGVLVAGTYTKTYKRAVPRKYVALVGGLVFVFK